MRKAALIAALLWLTLGGAWGQSTTVPHPPGRGPGGGAPVTVTAAVDRDQVAIGESFHLTVEVSSDPKTEIAYPSAESFTFSPFEVRSSIRSPLPPQGGQNRVRYSFELVGYEPGKTRVPPLRIDYGKKEHAESNDLTVEITRVKPNKTDREGEVRGPKPLIEVAAPWWYYALGALLAVLAVAALWLAIRALRNRRRLRPPLPPPLPHVWALQELERLAAMRLPAAGRYMEYYERLTAILRTYLARCLQLHVLERTTAEILADMRGRNMDEQLRGQVRVVLEEADLVKFARAVAVVERAEAHMSTVRWIVEATRPVEVPQPNGKAHGVPVGRP